MPTGFGATDTLCTACKGVMHLTRAHPNRGYAIERQRLACRVWKYEIARDTDVLGEVLV
jgi:hypothetical protein